LFYKRRTFPDSPAMNNAGNVGPVNTGGSEYQNSVVRGLAM
jgi:hypothetical protein